MALRLLSISSPLDSNRSTRLAEDANCLVKGMRLDMY